MVRTYYKKAIRILYFNKNKDKDFLTKYLAESLYKILNEANSLYFNNNNIIFLYKNFLIF